MQSKRLHVFGAVCPRASAFPFFSFLVSPFNLKCRMMLIWLFSLLFMSSFTVSQNDMFSPLQQGANSFNVEESSELPEGSNDNDGIGAFYPEVSSRRSATVVNTQSHRSPRYFGDSEEGLLFNPLEEGLWKLYEKCTTQLSQKYPEDELVIATFCYDIAKHLPKKEALNLHMLNKKVAETYMQRYTGNLHKICKWNDDDKQRFKAHELLIHGSHSELCLRSIINYYKNKESLERLTIDGLDSSHENLMCEFLKSCPPRHLALKNLQQAVDMSCLGMWQKMRSVSMDSLTLTTYNQDPILDAFDLLPPLQQLNVTVDSKNMLGLITTLKSDKLPKSLDIILLSDLWEDKVNPLSLQPGISEEGEQLFRSLQETNLTVFHLTIPVFYSRVFEGIQNMGSLQRLSLSTEGRPNNRRLPNLGVYSMNFDALSEQSELTSLSIDFEETSLICVASANWGSLSSLQAVKTLKFTNLIFSENFHIMPLEKLEDLSLMNLQLNMNTDNQVLTGKIKRLKNLMIEAMTHPRLTRFAIGIKQHEAIDPRHSIQNLLQKVFSKCHLRCEYQETGCGNLKHIEIESSHLKGGLLLTTILSYFSSNTSLRTIKIGTHKFSFADFRIIFLFKGRRTSQWNFSHIEQLELSSDISMTSEDKYEIEGFLKEKDLKEIIWI